MDIFTFSHLLLWLQSQYGFEDCESFLFEAEQLEKSDKSTFDYLQNEGWRKLADYLKWDNKSIENDRLREEMA